MFPKKLHLTCKDKNIENIIWKKCYDKYKEIYNDYEIIIYDNNDIYNIVEKHYPEYLDKIKQINIGAVLADIFRYLILYLEGGIYSDLDCEPLKKIDTLFTDKYFHSSDTNDNTYYVYPTNKNIVNSKWDFYDNPCNNCIQLDHHDKSLKKYKCLGHMIGNVSTILCYEFQKAYYGDKIFDKDERLYKDVGICQWFMMTYPKQDIFLQSFLKCMENIDKLINIKKDNNYIKNILTNSGPLVFTKSVMNNITDKIHILSADFFCAYSMFHSVPLTSNAYIKHHYTGTWWQ